MDLYWGGVAPIDLDRSSRECRRGVAPFALHLQRSVGRERVAYVEGLRNDVVFEWESFLVDHRRKIRHRYDPKIPAQVLACINRAHAGHGSGDGDVDLFDIGRSDGGRNRYGE